MKKIRVTCSAGFLLLMAGLIYLDGILIFFQTLFACALHEAAHGGAAVCFGSRVCALRFTASGAEMEFDSNVPFSYVQDAVVAIAGPAANLIAAYFALQFDTPVFAGLNLCFGFLNLIPVCPFDGGRIITDLLSLLKPELAEKLNSGLSILLSGSLLGLGCAALHRWGNISLLCTAIWFVYAMYKEEKINN